MSGLGRTATLWLALLSFDTGGQLAFKLGSAVLTPLDFGPAWGEAALSSPWILGGLGCYLGSFLCWMLILRHTALSLAFPLTALGYVSILLASALLLGEEIDAWRWTGVAVILSGIFLLGGEEKA